MIGKDKKHAFTKSSQLHNRCVEALYMATLLEYGFGFDGSHRNITLALEVMGHEVEWTLGFALAEVPLPPPHNPDEKNEITPIFNSVQLSVQSVINSLYSTINRVFSQLAVLLSIFSGRK